MKQFLCVILSLAGVLFAADYTVTPATNIVLDGQLDEVDWKNAPVIEDFVLLKASGRSTPTYKTTARILANEDALYFGIVCEGANDVKDDLKGRVVNAWDNDLVEIFLAPTESLDEYYQFAITAGGAYWNQFFAESGNIHPDFYEPQFQVATGRTENSWVLEIRFPTHAFYNTNASTWHNEWAVNIARYYPPRDNKPAENSSWAVLNQSFHEIQAFHKIDGIPPKKQSYDLRIAEANFNTTALEEKGIGGDLSVQVVLESAPEGQYVFELLGTTQELSLKRGTNTISLPAYFEKEGRTPVRMTLRNAEGKTVADRLYPVLVEATPVTLHFDAPLYGGNFYPGEDASRLKGTLKVNLPGDSITLTVAGKGYALPVVNGVASFDIDISGIQGDMPISVGEYLQTTVRRISDALAWIRDGRIVVDGAPTLLLGWYGSPAWITSKPLREKYPTIRGKHPITFDGWINIEPARILEGRIETEEMVYDQKPSQKVFDAMDRVIAENQSSPHFCYYLCDEPECRGLSPVYLRYLYQHLKQKDPRRLVMIISREPVRYIECADIINPHPYISPSVTSNGLRTYHLSLQRLRDMCASVETLQRPDKALMLTPQIFAYTFNDVYADYPTFDEINVGIWSSVCHGSQGITPYIWYDHFARPCTDLGSDFIYNSLFHLKEYLLSTDTHPLPGDEGRVFNYNGEALYLIDNVFLEPRTYEFETTAPTLYRFRENGQVIPENGRVSLELAPYDVVILSTKKLDDGLTTEADLRAAIAKADYDRSHRGNLLFGKGRQVELRSVNCEPYILQNTMEQQDKLFDGNTIVSAWMPRKPVGGTPWLEMVLPANTPKFSKARIYGNGLNDLQFYIWDGEKWVTPQYTHTDSEYATELNFGKSLSTKQIRLELLDNQQDPELYEFELLE